MPAWGHASMCVCGGRQTLGSPCAQQLLHRFFREEAAVVVAAVALNHHWPRLRAAQRPPAASAAPNSSSNTQGNTRHERRQGIDSRFSHSRARGPCQGGVGQKRAQFCCVALSSPGATRSGREPLATDEGQNIAVVGSRARTQCERVTGSSWVQGSARASQCWSKNSSSGSGASSHATAVSLWSAASDAVVTLSTDSCDEAR